MFDAQRAKRLENDRSQAVPAQKTSETKQITQHTEDLTRVPLFAQAWGDLPPSWLCLPSPQTASPGQPVQQQVEEGLQNDLSSQQMNEFPCQCLHRR